MNSEATIKGLMGKYKNSHTQKAELGRCLSDCRDNSAIAVFDATYEPDQCTFDSRVG